MKRTLNYTVPSEYHNKNILGFLKSRGYSHAVLAHLKRTESGILLNNTWARVSDTVHTGDTITVNLVETQDSHTIVPAKLPLSILYEDEDLLIVNKAAGMPIHPSQGNYDNTLANALAYYFREKGEPFIYRCINRLDRDTTGLLIVARHMLSASLLSAMVANRDIHREYLALATGLTEKSGTVCAPIGRAADSTIERRIDPEHGAYACTRYTRLDYCKGYSLLSLTLDTGRTHQIRVHMKHIGHPLPGDFLYNPDYSFIKRQALHSHRLTFKHPITGHTLSFTAPLPQDMRI